MAAAIIRKLPARICAPEITNADFCHAGPVTRQKFSIHKNFAQCHRETTAIFLPADSAKLLLSVFSVSSCGECHRNPDYRNILQNGAREVFEIFDTAILKNFCIISFSAACAAGVHRMETFCVREDRIGS